MGTWNSDQTQGDLHTAFAGMLARTRRQSGHDFPVLSGFDFGFLQYYVRFQ